MKQKKGNDILVAYFLYYLFECICVALCISYPFPFHTLTQKTHSPEQINKARAYHRLHHHRTTTSANKHLVGRKQN